MGSDRYIQVEGKILRLTNLGKILFPEIGFTKKDVIDYYRAVAPVALPHLRARPFTLLRYPEGVEEPFFYEKKCPAHRPMWLHTAWMDGIRFCTIDDLPSLLWVANLAAIELHTTLARSEDLTRPTMMVFDLDPGELTSPRACAQVAIWIRALLEREGLASFVKFSGKKGLHVLVPLNTEVTYPQTKSYCRDIAVKLEKRHPDRVTGNMSKKLRIGRVFIDWSQNVDFKSTVNVYSIRARNRPTVSAPLRWAEVEKAAASEIRAQAILALDTTETLKRIDRYGDLFDPLLTLRQTLPPLKNLAA